MALICTSLVCLQPGNVHEPVVAFLEHIRKVLQALKFPFVKIDSIVHTVSCLNAQLNSIHPVIVKKKKQVAQKHVALEFISIIVI